MIKLNYKAIFSILILLNVANCSSHKSTSNDDSLVNVIDLNQAILTDRDNTVIIDVRSRESYNLGHIPKAINIPFSKLNSFKNAQQAKTFGLRSDVNNYVYCYHEGCALGPRAVKKFISLGYPSKEIKGGFKTWKERKLPIDQ